MILTYENRNTEIALERKNSIHVPPHLHEAIEMVYVTEGSVELGVGQELYHLEKGDFGIVFPNVIHHYQVFGSGRNRAVYLFAEPTFFTSYMEELQNYCPKVPIIKKDKIKTLILDMDGTLKYYKKGLIKENKDWVNRIKKNRWSSKSIFKW